jgi:hypothetical protein
MATRFTGTAALAFAQRTGCTLSAHAAHGEEARDGLSIDEARAIAVKDPDRIYVDVDEPEDDGTRVA